MRGFDLLDLLDHRCPVDHDGDASGVDPRAGVQSLAHLGRASRPRLSSDENRPHPAGNGRRFVADCP